MSDHGRTIDADIRSEWEIDPQTVYLNHGSFGPSPRGVRRARQEFSERLERQPMDFFLRQMEALLQAAAERLGQFIGADAKDLCFVDNATTAMNIVADSHPLQAGDEVLLTDHEYGAVQRIWRRRCERRQARMMTARMPAPTSTAGDVVSALFAAVTPATRLIVVSHVTSPTAVTLPVEAICREARRSGIAVCIDGPHALAMQPLNLRRLDCDYYCASGHKWLSAPFGSGFLFVAPRHQGGIVSPILSWGGSVSGRPARWQDELNWLGTRDPAAFLAMPAAIEFLESFGIERFRSETHALVREAGTRVSALTGCPPFVPLDSHGFGSMLACHLPPGVDGPPKPGHRDPLQTLLWENERIEIPIVHWHGHRLIRLSCHLYNTPDHIERLVDGLKRWLPGTCAIR